MIGKINLKLFVDFSIINDPLRNLVQIENLQLKIEADLSRSKLQMLLLPKNAKNS